MRGKDARGCYADESHVDPATVTTSVLNTLTGARNGVGNCSSSLATYKPVNEAPRCMSAIAFDEVDVHATPAEQATSFIRAWLCLAKNDGKVSVHQKGVMLTSYRVGFRHITGKWLRENFAFTYESNELSTDPDAPLAERHARTEVSDGPLGMSGILALMQEYPAITSTVFTMNSQGKSTEEVEQEVRKMVQEMSQAAETTEITLEKWGRAAMGFRYKRNDKTQRARIHEERADKKVDALFFPVPVEKRRRISISVLVGDGDVGVPLQDVEVPGQALPLQNGEAATQLAICDTEEGGRDETILSRKGGIKRKGKDEHPQPTTCCFTRDKLADGKKITKTIFEKLQIIEWFHSIPKYRRTEASRLTGSRHCQPGSVQTDRVQTVRVRTDMVTPTD